MITLVSNGPLACHPDFRHKCAYKHTKTGCCHALYIGFDPPVHRTFIMMIISRRWRRRRLHFLWTGHHFLGALDDRVKHIRKENYKGIIFSNTVKIGKCSFSVNWRKNHRYRRRIQSCSWISGANLDGTEWWLGSRRLGWMKAPPDLHKVDLYSL